MHSNTGNILLYNFSVSINTCVLIIILHNYDITHNNIGVQTFVQAFHGYMNYVLLSPVMYLWWHWLPQWHIRCARILLTVWICKDVELSQLHQTDRISSTLFISEHPWRTQHNTLFNPTCHQHAGLQYDANFEAVSSMLVATTPLLQLALETWTPNLASSSLSTQGDHPEQVKWKTHDGLKND